MKKLPDTVNSCEKCPYKTYAGITGMSYAKTWGCELIPDDIGDAIENDTIPPACPLEDVGDQK